MDWADPVSPDMRVVWDTLDPNVGAGPVSYAYATEDDKMHMMAKAVGMGGDFGVPTFDKQSIDIVKKNLRAEREAKKDAMLLKSNPYHPLVVAKGLAFAKDAAAVQAKLSESFGAMGGKKGYAWTPEQADLLFAYKEGKKRGGIPLVSDLGVHLQATKGKGGTTREAKRKTVSDWWNTQFKKDLGADLPRYSIPVWDARTRLPEEGSSRDPFGLRGEESDIEL